MHNGVFESLEDVIDFFDQGGGAGNTILKSLNLDEEEKRALKIFMVEALSGEDINITFPKIP